jgi:hypothetical protein
LLTPGLWVFADSFKKFSSITQGDVQRRIPIDFQFDVKIRWCLAPIASPCGSFLAGR